MKKLTIALLATSALAGCNPTWNESTLEKPPAASDAAASGVVVQKTAADVQVIPAPAAGTFEVLQELKVRVNKTTAFHPDPTKEQVIAKLRQDAAKLGADALIDVAVSEAGVSALSWSTRTGSGKAIKFLK